MPKTITKELTLYTFKELVNLEGTGSGLDKACENARQWLQEGQTFDGWWDHTYDTWKSALAQIGFDDAEISFSGFWSQGDGASFTCKSVDMEKLIEFLLSDIEPNKAISYDGKTEDFRGWLVNKISRPNALPGWRQLKSFASGEVERISNHYSHESTCVFRITDTSLTPNLESACEALRLNICHAIYKDLEEEYEWLTSDEQLIETAEANDYMFNEDGEMELE